MLTASVGGEKRLGIVSPLSIISAASCSIYHQSARLSVYSTYHGCIVVSTTSCERLRQLVVTLTMDGYGLSHDMVYLYRSVRVSVPAPPILRPEFAERNQVRYHY